MTKSQYTYLHQNSPLEKQEAMTQILKAELSEIASKYKHVDSLESDPITKDTEYLIVPINQNYAANLKKIESLNPQNPGIKYILAFDDQATHTPDFLSVAPCMKDIIVTGINLRAIGSCFLGRTNITSVDFTAVPNIQTVDTHFLLKTPIKSLNLAPFSKVWFIGLGCLAECFQLKKLDLEHLHGIKIINGFFLYNSPLKSTIKIPDAIQDKIKIKLFELF